MLLVLLWRFYSWLIIHDVCPCSCAARLRFGKSVANKLCDLLERKMLDGFDKRDNELFLSEAEARICGAAIVDEYQEDLRKLGA